MNESCFIGIDIGTQGARVVLVNTKGEILGEEAQSFPLNAGSREEQSPADWWEACHSSLVKLCGAAEKTILSRVMAMAVTSTSGTIVPVDAAGDALHNALMYSDTRSETEASLCKKTAETFHPEGFTSFNASCGLPKMRWFSQHHPDKMDRLCRFIHATDYINGKLSGQFSITDYTNALKSGYDLDALAWPDYIQENLGIPKKQLPNVTAPGSPIAKIRKELAATLGLPENLVLTAGMTDGCASQIASGAVNPGDWNTTIGTTMVIKGVTRKKIHDPSGALYCHRHPQGCWMPGGASNTGADWVRHLFGNADLAGLNKAAEEHIPTLEPAWPLLQKGERFPFVSPQAQGFFPEGMPESRLFAACMEGVAYMEKYAFERIKFLSGETIERVYTAGGASNSDAWLRIRSNVLNLPVLKMRHASGAAGAAVLAASGTAFTSLSEAATAMVHPEKTVEPAPLLSEAYGTGYENFIQTLVQKGYITK